MFNRENSFGRGESRRSGGYDRRDSGRGRQDHQMHEVICDSCGKKCEVPFRPTEGKPVYCNDCFKKPESSERRGGSSRNNDLDAINAKLDKILSILENN